MKNKAFHKNSQQKHFVGGAFIFQFGSSIIDSLFKGGTHQCSTKIFTLLCCSVLFLPTIQPNPFPLEAAFQGKCPPDGNPCTQICFNIHNNMYECGCKNGFILSADGYNCILQEGSNSTGSHQQHKEINQGKDTNTGRSTSNQVLDEVSELNPKYQNDNERKSSSFQNPLQNTIASSKAPLSIHIEVDIDPPPDDGKESKKLSEDELKKLGLPSHHVHWSLPPVLSLSRKDEDTMKEQQNSIVGDNTLNAKINEVARARSKGVASYNNQYHSMTQNDRVVTQQGQNTASKENLLAPSDIHITYSVSDNDIGSGQYENDVSLNMNSFDDDESHDSDTDSWIFGKEDSEKENEILPKPSAWYSSKVEDKSNNENIEEIEPPRALPSRIVNNIPSGHHKNGDLSDRFPHTMKLDSMNDNSKNLKTKDDTENNNVMKYNSEGDESNSCDLDCGVEGGSCFMEKEHHYKNDRNFNENDWVKIKKRCLCPLGKQGTKCEMDQSITSPHFSGRTSHLSLPTLTNAYSDLQLSLEFKPESNDGVILLTGETQEMTGDYLAIVLREGHVELRLDCGTGPGAVTTSGKVRLNHWNRLTVFRHDWGVWLQLNGGRHDEGRSQGLFSRITFALPVVLGSPEGHFSNTGHFLESSGAFQGCIRNLEINNKLYNFALQNNGGDAIEGVDIDECFGGQEEESCKTVNCHHHGSCAMKNVSVKDGLKDFDGFDVEGDDDVMMEPYCKCPLGFHGQYCEKAVDVQVPSFDGTSYIIYGGFPNIDASPLWNELEFVIRPKSLNGLIFYNGNDMFDSENSEKDVNSGDFLAVFLSKGYLEFAFNAGDGITIIRSHHPLKLNHWHTVKVSRTGLLAEIQVDRQRRVSHIGAGAFTQVSTSDYNVYIGGVPTFEIVSPFIPVKTSYEGCIQKVSINNVNLPMMQAALAGMNVGPCTDHPCSSGYIVSADDSRAVNFPEMSLNNFGVPPCGDHGICKPHLDNFTCECPLFSSGDRCQYQLPLLDADRRPAIPGFTGDSFLHFENDEIAKNLIGNSNSINMRVKIAPNSRGLILWTGGDTMSPASDYLMLGIADNGKLHYRFNLGNGEAVLIYNETSIDDGRWHRIKATRTEQTATLKVDGGHIITGASPGKLRQLNGNGHLFIGGTEDLEYLPIPKFRKGMQGCVGELSIGRVYAIDMIQRAKTGRNVDTCHDYNNNGSK